ncbi:lipoprotein lipase-like [Chironomus tepperi]|uniref:lipoprotein lipase-like n=1 Tax=Chironomus tepperi TaxID=113505 RepID=UPI00391F65E6
MDELQAKRKLTTYDDHVAFPLSSAQELFNDPHFDPSRKTVLYMHGYDQLIDDENIRTIVAAYQTRNDYNILILDWITIGSGDYIFTALPNTAAFSKIVADVLIDLFTQGLDIKKVHVVSHSLGSHLAGMVGREIQLKSNRKLILKRITCLDPAFPGFYAPIPFFKAVNKDDAEFVDIIHTETGTYGTPFPTGTVDFWVNGLTFNQPGCPPRNFRMLDKNDLCSHHRSWRIWAESVSNKSSKFWSQKCSPFWFFSNTCESNMFVSMGIDCPTGISSMKCESFKVFFLDIVDLLMKSQIAVDAC